MERERCRVMPETSLPEPGVLPRHDHREGRLRWQRDDLTCWCVPALEAPLRAIYLDCAWVYDALRSRPD
ncbi:hypothetical protein RZS08_66010, partial [Arthrospira platensis SPKY1]|nr:hypothetical protein [Arthrospira platensis SPKY1]